MRMEVVIVLVRLKFLYWEFLNKLNCRNNKKRLEGLSENDVHLIILPQKIRNIFGSCHFKL